MAEARLYYPDSIRARYGRRGDDFKNAVHGSDTRECAEKEIHFFFPDCKDLFFSKQKLARSSLNLFLIFHSGETFSYFYIAQS